MIGSNNTPSWMPLHGLLEFAFDAIVEEFCSELERGLRLTEIAERGNMTKQSAGEVVDYLVARGYVERVPDPDDRRAKLARLTERGTAAQAYGFRLLAEIEKRWGERYGAERIAGLRAMLEEIAAVEAPFAMPEAVSAAPARL